ncbi:MAG: hypothetical protein RR197_02885 [Oscillospiraceae bacterium]
MAEQQSSMGAAFWQVTPAAPMNARGWRAVERAVGEHSANVLFSPELIPPERLSVARFTGEAHFMPLLCANTAAVALADSGLPAARRRVGLIDLRGVRQSLVLRLLPHASSVLVMTEHPARYRAFCAQVLERFGTSVRLCASDSPMSDCAVVVAPEGILAAHCGTLSAPVLSAREPPHPPRACVMADLRLSATTALPDAAVPPGIEPTLFAAALYELGRVHALESSTASRGRMGGKWGTLAEFSACIAAGQDENGDGNP